jgi:predicted Zn finger-like uncharacterized protein
MTEMKTQCPNCRKTYRVPESRLGKQARCQNCSQMFTVEMAVDETMAPRSKEGESAAQPSAAMATPPPLKPKTGSASGSRPRLQTGPTEAGQLAKIGQYVVRRKLGEGGMGVVWLAHDPGLQRDVAIKVLPSECAKDAVYLKRFLREARAAAKLNHPHTVTIYQVGTDGSLVYLAMELVDGASLDEAVQSGKPMDWREATRAVRDAAAGLAAAHEIGLVHRDIKPANLMRTTGGVTKVVDFGLARAQVADTQLTQQGAVVGTPAYMAPEQWVGTDADARTDLYSLTCTYYHLLTGKPPYEAASIPALGYQHRHEPFPDPRQLVPDLPEAVYRVLARGAQKDPANRYQTAAELMATLDDLLAMSSEELRYDEIFAAKVPGKGPARKTQPAVATPGVQQARNARKAVIAPRLRTPGWATVAAAGLGGIVLLLGVIIYVATNNESNTKKAAETRKPQKKVPVLSIDWPESQRARAVLFVNDEMREVPPTGAIEIPLPPSKEQYQFRLERTGFQPKKFGRGSQGDDQGYTVSEWEPLVPVGSGKEPSAQTSTAGRTSLNNLGTNLNEISVELGNGVKLEMVLIPAGEFLMGSPDSNMEAANDEKPQHRVRITKPFYLGKYPVTQEQWEAVMGNKPSNFHGPKNPVEQVSWDDCQQFLKKLNDRFPHPGPLPTMLRTVPGEGEFRLPTEAQWECACRAGSTTRYCFGDDESGLGEYAWYSVNSGQTTHQAGEKKPNAWGLYDMHGNVWEWCADCYDGGYYAHSPTDDPTGPATGSLRVSRGGSWRYPARRCRSWHRLMHNPGYRRYDLGLRVSRVPADAVSGMRSRESAAPLKIQPIPAQTVNAGKPLRVLPETDFDLGNGVRLEMLLIPAGEFLMGSTRSDKSAKGTEKPQHRVRITKPFYLGKYLVTQEQWEAVMGNNPGHLKGPKNPVEQVSWDDCQQFLKKLNDRFFHPGPLPEREREFRLPTEAQWEYACRAGSTTRYCFGDDESGLGEYAWYSANSGRMTHPVGEKRPNAWGLYDMHGNALEWCSDRYGRYGFDANATMDDPAGPATGSERALRGGSYISDIGECRSADRSYASPAIKWNLFGLRVSQVGAQAGEASKLAETLKLWSIAAQSVELGKPLNVAVTAQNADAWKGKVRYGLGLPAPPGASIDQQSGEFSWTPKAIQTVGKCNVTVMAQGPGGQAVQTTFVVTVTRPAPRVISVNLARGVKLEMVLIPAGEFLMGSTSSDKDAGSNEYPLHRVRITKPFYLGKYPVTQEQWQSLMGNDPSASRDPKEPVGWATWEDCQQFVAKLNAKFGRRNGEFCLPTEAQWEYACRAGSTTRYCFGDDVSQLGQYAWYEGSVGKKSHTQVGRKKPNAWGLYDMHGLVWEWCADWYDGGYYAVSPTDDPTGPATGSPTFNPMGPATVAEHVRRGGCMLVPASLCRSAGRNVGGSDVSRGLRVSRVPAE